jgi:hypothetical protein
MGAGLRSEIRCMGEWEAVLWMGVLKGMGIYRWWGLFGERWYSGRESEVLDGRGDTVRVVGRLREVKVPW